MIKTAVQIAIFALSLTLIILCYIKSSKGGDMLKGLSNTGSELFAVSKKDVGDKLITRVIWIFIAVLFILLLISPAL